ncbi:MICOS complex subunit [Wolffia australiana]
MLRRLVSGLSTSRSFSKSSTTRVAAQTPYFLSSRCSSSSPAKPDTSKGSGSSLRNIAIGTFLAGSALAAAYQTGYIENLQFKHEKPSKKQNTEISQNSAEEVDSQYQVKVPVDEVVYESPKPEPDTESPNPEPKSLANGGEAASNEESRDVFSAREEVPLQNQENISEPQSNYEELSHTEKDESQSLDSLDGVSQNADETVSEVSSIEIPDISSEEPHDVPHLMDGDSGAELLDGNLPNNVPGHGQIPDDVSEEYASPKAEISPPSSVDSDDEEIFAVPVHLESPESSVSSNENEEVSREEPVELDIPKDHKIILDLIDAIHAAEERQANSDHRLFSLEKQKMKEKYEKELRDARAMELMYAEEAAILDKELNRERLKAEAALKLLEEKAEENLRLELKRKEEEIESRITKIQDLGKAELTAAIVKEKACHMEKMSEANLNIQALCMAFYARSEEARLNSSIHKLALGTLALENALSKGLPIRAEIDSLQSSLVGVDRDSLLDLVLASLPEDTMTNGSQTLLQLRQKFDSLKGTLRHFSLIPVGGGGMLAHAVAHVASALKMRENNTSGEGIESVISKVEGLLAEGNLTEAAAVLEMGVSGTEAEAAISEWVKLARHRAVTEQALSLLRAYATSISLT